MQNVHFIERKLGLAVIIIMLLTISACNNQDDVNAHFSIGMIGNTMEKPWKITLEQKDVVKKKLPYTSEKLQEQFCRDGEIFQIYPDLHITHFEITDRRTNTQGGTDLVTCAVSAENHSFSYSAFVTMSFTLYDQGWLLENMDSYEEAYCPLNCTITQDMADGLAATLDYDEAVPVGNDISLEDGRAYFYYDTKEYEGYWEIDSYLMLIYEFTPETGWAFKEEDLTTDSEHWNLNKLCGTWRTEKAGMDGYFEMTIENIDSDHGIVSGSYSCDINDIGLTQRLQRDEAGDFSFGDDWWYLVGGSIFQRFRIEIDKYNGVVFGDKYCEKIN